MYDLQALFTDRKVARTLAAKLPDRQFEGVHWDRWSVVRDAAGAATQVRTTTKLYPDDPDVAAYTSIPQEAFDPNRAGLAARYGLVWIRLSEIHPLATSDEYVGCFWPGERTLFFRITSSAVKRQIHRFDGADENAYTTLTVAVFAHYDCLQWTRWASDITRAARDNVNWALEHRTCEDRGISMVFGTSTYHPMRDRKSLAILGVFGKEEDYERRQKLTGTTVQKAKDGGAPRSERQMAHGFRHQRVPGTNRRVKDATRGFLPEPMADFAPTLRTLVYAAAKTNEHGQYVTPWREITRLLAVHDVERRGQTRDGSYRDLFGEVDYNDPAAVGAAEDLNREQLYRVGRSFFINNDYRARTPALRAEDPELTMEEELYLHKVLLWKTGVFLQKRENDVRGRDVDVKGERPTYRGALDEFGYFPIRARWGFPTDPDTGQELTGWGIPDDVWGALINRLLSETREARPRGGRAHLTGRRRFLEDFGTWATGTEGAEDQEQQASDTGDVAPQQEWTIGARQNNTRKGRPGRQNIVLLCRPWAEGTRADGSRRGWSAQQSKPGRYVRATANLAELAGDLRCRLRDQIHDRLLDEQQLAPVALPARRPSRDTAEDQVRALQLKLDSAERERNAARSQAESLRVAAAAFLTGDEPHKFGQYDALADTSDATAEKHEKERSELEARIAACQTLAPRTAAQEDVEVDISVGAYLDEALRRAALTNGDVPWQAAAVADRTFRDWRFAPDRDLVHYRCVAALPLVGGGTLDLPLTGTITNIRTKAGKATAVADTIAYALFGQGRELEELAEVHESTRRALVIRRVMPWLVEHGMTDRAIKCALLDHPLAAPKQVVYGALTGQVDRSHERWSAGWRAIVTDVYLTNPPHWGFAACPDDTTTIQQIVATLALPRHRQAGLPVTVLAALTGLDAKAEIRRLAVPEDRAVSGLGFTRPRYLEYAPGSNKQNLRVKPCPHRGCPGVADRVLLLPEVAASGWAVLCSTCWRAPVTPHTPGTGSAQQALQARWATAPFPRDYATYLTGRGGPAGSLRDRNETLIDHCPVPLDVAASSDQS